MSEPSDATRPSAADDPFVVEADLRALRDFDPTRVRLIGLRVADWPVEAACAGQADARLDPWHLDGEATGSDRRAAAALARETCESCPVRVQCLALALALLPLGYVEGIYAGFDPRELRSIARARGLAYRKVAQHGTRARYVSGCDCAPCARAHATYYREQRAQARYAETDARPTATYAEAG